MKSKIKAKAEAATGRTLNADDLVLLEAICEGIVEEITTNGKVNPGTFANGAGAVSGQGTIE
jgi:hypothetical protein